MASCCRPTVCTSRHSIAASSSATASSRRCGRTPGRVDGARRSPGPPAPLGGGAGHRPARRPRRPGRGRRSPSCSRRTASMDQPATRRCGSRSRAAPSAAAGLLPPDEVVRPTVVIQAWPVLPDTGRAPRARSSTHRLGGPSRSVQPAGDAQDRVARRLRLCPARGTPGGRRRCPLPDARRAPVRGDDLERLPGPARRRRRHSSSPPRRSSARSCPERRARGSCPGAAVSGCDRSRDDSRSPISSPRMRPSSRRASPGSCR